MGKGIQIEPERVSVATAVKGVILAAAAIAALGGIFQAGAWLLGTAFVSNEAFAAHQAADTDLDRMHTERMQRLTEGQLVTCMVAANGRLDRMAMCERVLIRKDE